MVVVGAPGSRCWYPGLGVDVFGVEFAMPAGRKRYYGKGHLHFITFRCYGRLPLPTTPWARDVFVRELGKAREGTGFELIGYVVMAEHRRSESAVIEV